MCEKDSPAEGIVSAFIGMRERCRHYKGFKQDLEAIQCCHPDSNNGGAWCAMAECPRLEQAADPKGVWQ